MDILSYNYRILFIREQRQRILTGLPSKYTLTALNLMEARTKSMVILPVNLG